MAQARPGAPPPLEHPSNRPPTACRSYKRRDQTMIAGETRPAELETPVTISRGTNSARMGRVALSAPDHGRYVRPVFIEPRHGFRPVYGVLKRGEGGVFERLRHQPVWAGVAQFMKAFVARALLQTISDPRAGRLDADHGGSG